MSQSSEIREFLMTRRNKIQPEDVGLMRGTRRRVSGLRREEVATLAGVSVDYYVQVERGKVAGVSDEVLASIAKALQLDDAEKTHLFNLVHSTSPSRQILEPPVHISDALQQIIDSMAYTPTIILAANLDIIGSNALGRAFYSAVFETQQEPNLARYVFYDKDSERFYDDWDANANNVTAILRAELARGLSLSVQDVIDDLSRNSDAFVRKWQVHDVVNHTSGVKVVHHAEVGKLHMKYEALEVPNMPGARIFCYTHDSDYPETWERLQLLAKMYLS